MSNTREYIETAHLRMAAGSRITSTVADDGALYDYIDGKQVPARIVDGSETIHQHQGSVHVVDGGRLDVIGPLQGTLTIARGGEATISGAVQGTLHVGQGARVSILGKQQGTVHVDPGGFVEVAPSGALQGTLHIDGELRNAGTRGGLVSGSGSLDDLSGSRVVQPKRRERGGAVVYVYEWPS